MKRKLGGQQEVEEVYETLVTTEPSQKQLKNDTDTTKQQSNCTVSLITQIGSDCLANVISFLDMDDLYPNLLLSKAWAKFAIPHFLQITREVYLSQSYLDDLRETLQNGGDDEFDGLYTECAHWKAWLGYDDDEVVGYTNLDDSDDSEDEEIEIKRIKQKEQLIHDDIRATTNEGVESAPINNNENNNVAIVTKEEEKTVVEVSTAINIENQIPETEVVGTRMFYKKAPFGIPLSKGSIIEQYQLVQSKLTTQEYKELVKKQLNVNITETIPQNPFLYYDIMKDEQRQADIYINETLEAMRRDQGECIRVGNFDGHPVYSEDLDFESMQTDTGFCFYAFRGGIHRLLKRGGVKFYSPQIVVDSIQLLKDFIEPVIREAYDSKFGDKDKPLEFKEPKEQYDVYWEHDEDPTFDDTIDSDLKINSDDIIEALEKVHGMSLLFGLEPLTTNDDKAGGFYDKTEKTPNKYFFERSQQSQEESKKEENDDEENENSDTNTDNDNNTEENKEENEEEDILERDKTLKDFELELEEGEDEDEVMEEETTENNQEEKLIIDDNNFIDDSELIKLTEENFTPEQLGNSLQDRLIKVSIRVHEEVYGKERTHNEKLYLKNWYGHGPLFFSRCASNLGDENPEEEDNDEQVVEELLMEEELIEKNRKEDLAYFGYSLYDDDEGEYPEILENEEGEHANEEESKEYHLRRLLRQESIKCIAEYYGKKEEEEKEPIPPANIGWLF
ncbi:hypothetical protein ABK040_016106 [Willaertia magna]